MKETAAPGRPAPSLLPRPQRVRWGGGEWRLPVTLSLHAPAELLSSPALEWLTRALAMRGHGLHLSADLTSAHVALQPGPLAFAPMTDAATEAYALSVTNGSVHLRASGAPGLQRAITTLIDLVEAADAGTGQLALPCVSIEDWPDFAARGVMLDVSRDKVPAIATLHLLVDRLARWKVNQLQLYMEHTFAYREHERVWRHASPFTAEEIRGLDAYCAARHIELVPNQNSLGHMHRWLTHEPYRALAECPDGFEHPWNWSGEPYGLCATDPSTLVFLEQLYDELLPNFQSRLFNVGLDEPLDLGAGRSRAACESRGTDQVYLEYLHEVHARVQGRGRKLAFWADIVVKRPDLLAALPRDVVALEWGYEADHPFAEHLARLQQAGIDFYVCPGTSSWNSIAGRTDNAIANAAKAAREGKAAGASGLLMTDWGDHGHLQPLSVSYLGLLLGACFGWNTADAERPFDLPIARWLDTHAFMDAAGVLGRAAYDLGNAYREAGSLRPNASVLFWSLIKPERLFSPPGVTRETLEHTLSYLERAGEPLSRARPSAPDGALIVDELGYARDLLAFACRLGVARSDSSDPAQLAGLSRARRAALASELEGLIERHGSVWAKRNRSGGQTDSVRRLTRIAESLS